MPAPQQILIVDDDPQVLKYLTAVLVRAGYSVVSTASGKDALEVAAGGSVGLIILDLSMPEPDGFEVLKVLRARVPGPKIIVISGAIGGVLLDAAKYFGASAALDKPVSAQQLLETVGNLLGE
jgi:CheY-like chemotaxis protein